MKFHHLHQPLVMLMKCLPILLLYLKVGHGVIVLDGVPVDIDGGEGCDSAPAINGLIANRDPLLSLSLFEPEEREEADLLFNELERILSPAPDNDLVSCFCLLTILIATAWFAESPCAFCVTCHLALPDANDATTEIHLLHTLCLLRSLTPTSLSSLSFPVLLLLFFLTLIFNSTVPVILHAFPCHFDEKLRSANPHTHECTLSMQMIPWDTPKRHENVPLLWGVCVPRCQRPLPISWIHYWGASFTCHRRGSSFLHVYILVSWSLWQVTLCPYLLFGLLLFLTFHFYHLFHIVSLNRTSEHHFSENNNLDLEFFWFGSCQVSNLL